MADAAHRHLGRPGFLIPHQKLPLAVFLVGVFLQSVRPQQLAGLVVVAIRLQLHQQRRIGVLLRVIEKIRRLFVVVEFLQKHVVYRHPPGAVLAGVDGHPLVRVLGNLTEIRGEDHHFRAVVPRLGGEMAVGRARHV